MNDSISIIEKKDFLKWFLKHYRFQKRECVWLLNYFISDDIVMENLHFVENAEYCSKAIILSTVCSNEIPFQFFKDSVETTDVEKSFHDIRLNPEDKIYVQLNFRDSHKNPHYGIIVEENPFLPESLQPAKQYEIWADLLISEAVQTYKEERLYAEIDKALDCKDKQAFLQLTKRLKND